MDIKLTLDIKIPKVIKGTPGLAKDRSLRKHMVNDITMAKRRTGIDDQAEKQFVKVKCKENYHKRANIPKFAAICFHLS